MNIYFPRLIAASIVSSFGCDNDGAGAKTELIKIVGKSADVKKKTVDDYGFCIALMEKDGFDFTATITTESQVARVELYHPLLRYTVKAYEVGDRSIYKGGAKALSFRFKTTNYTGLLNGPISLSGGGTQSTYYLLVTYNSGKQQRYKITITH